MIQVKNLSKNFGNLKAVDGITFEIEKGEIFGFLGPNGAGKTTTIRLLSCIIRPTSGTAFLDGLNILDHAMEIRKIVGVLTEHPCLYERLTPIYNLDFFGKLYEVPEGVRAQRIEELLTMFDLIDRKDEKVETFSKGMKQKLALARALFHNPKIVFLDEPTAALDPKIAKGVRDYIKKLSEEKEQITFISTHNLTEAEYLCDRVAVIDHGKIVGLGSPEELSKDIWKGQQVQIAVKNYNPQMQQRLAELDFIKHFEFQNNILKIDVENTMIDNPRIIEALVKAGAQIVSAEIKKHSLEEVYLNLIRD
jgi:ABC-2 type transport system ATP-binding protein